MSDHPQLDSAAAVEVAAFCWPGLPYPWEPVPNCEPGCALWTNWRDAEKEKIPEESGEFNFYDFNDLHRAAAVLVERGHGEVLGKHIWNLWTRYVGKKENFNMSARTITIPEEKLACAVLATVREVAK